MKQSSQILRKNVKMKYNGCAFAYIFILTFKTTFTKRKKPKKGGLAQKTGFNHCFQVTILPLMRACESLRRGANVGIVAESAPFLHRCQLENAASRKQINSSEN